MFILALLILLVILLIKKPSIVEDYAPFIQNNKLYMDYTNYLCNTRRTKGKDNDNSKCISIPLIEQRPQNTHPNSTKPLDFFHF